MPVTDVYTISVKSRPARSGHGVHSKFKRQTLQCQSTKHTFFTTAATDQALESTLLPVARALWEARMDGRSHRYIVCQALDYDTILILARRPKHAPYNAETRTLPALTSQVPSRMDKALRQPRSDTKNSFLSIADPAYSLSSLRPPQEATARSASEDRHPTLLVRWPGSPKPCVLASCAEQHKSQEDRMVGH